MQAHTRLLRHALRHLSTGQVAVKVDPRRVFLCLVGMSPAAVLKQTNLSRLAWNIIHAVAVGSAEGFDLPPAVAEHVTRWCDPGTRLRYRRLRRWLYRAMQSGFDGAWGRN
jgi:hypothetical protein